MTQDSSYMITIWHLPVIHAGIDGHGRPARRCEMRADVSPSRRWLPEAAQEHSRLGLEQTHHLKVKWGCILRSACTLDVVNARAVARIKAREADLMAAVRNGECKTL